MIQMMYMDFRYTDSNASNEQLFFSAADHRFAQYVIL